MSGQVHLAPAIVLNGHVSGGRPRVLRFVQQQIPRSRSTKCRPLSHWAKTQAKLLVSHKGSRWMCTNTLALPITLSATSLMKRQSSRQNDFKSRCDSCNSHSIFERESPSSWANFGYKSIFSSIYAIRSLISRSSSRGIYLFRNSKRYWATREFLVSFWYALSL